jgi:hypothetical protein
MTIAPVDRNLAKLASYSIELAPSISGTRLPAYTLAFFIEVAEPSRGIKPGDIFDELRPTQTTSPGRAFTEVSA